MPLAGSSSVTTFSQSASDLHGIARASDGPARDTVVWLDAPNAPCAPLEHSGEEEFLSRQTAGARVRLTNALALQVNALHETGDDEYLPRALDVALTWTVRKP